MGKQEMDATPQQRHYAFFAMTVIPQPPYLPDLAPADFFFFPKMKSSMTEQKLTMLRSLKKNCQRS